ncbi:MAG: zinc ribbon domain-containing protein YjdM [Bacteroidota bacterium]|nr:zinc ribbon domain-containing protein YjdM [Bacteroidota bacterium]
MQCPICHSELIYEDQPKWVCTQCFHEWIPTEEINESTPRINAEIKDSNGVVLQNGDSVLLIKDLPVKGAPRGLKAGTKVRNIRLSDGDHNITCRIDGFGAMELKSEFVRKV